MTIYFATKRLTITTAPAAEDLILDRSSLSIEQITTLFEQSDSIAIVADDKAQIAEIYSQLTTLLTPVVAAGGVVTRDDTKILMIHRNGRWDLPKGHWEQGETIEECALREVEEECGIGGLTLGRELCQTLHAYYMHQRWELKRTHWYSMHSSDITTPTPQTEEGIERAEWLSKDQVQSLIIDSFPTIKRVVSSYYDSSKR